MTWRASRVRPSEEEGTETEWDPTNASAVTAALTVLHTGTAPGEVRGREAERRQVLDLIQDCLKHKKSGSMYVCGLPGTGKSLTVSEAETAVRGWAGRKGGAGGGAGERVMVAAVNCMVGGLSTTRTRSTVNRRPGSALRYQHAP